MSRRQLGGEYHDWIETIEDESYAPLMLRLASADFDIIHNHPLSPIPLRFAQLLPTRLLTTLHVPILPRLRCEIEQRGCHSCGDFVNVSESNASLWRLLIPQQQMIHNGVDTELWKTCRAPKQRRVVWFGRILPDKGTHFAIELAHRAGLPIDVVCPISDQAYFDNMILPRLRSNDSYLGH